MDVTPAIKIGIMGGLGYIFAVVTKNDPKMTALAWLVAEAVVQIFQQAEEFQKRRLENTLRLVVGGAACIYLSEQHYLTKAIHAVISLVAFCLVPDIMNRWNFKLVVST